MPLSWTSQARLALLRPLLPSSACRPSPAAGHAVLHCTNSPPSGSANRSFTHRRTSSSSSAAQPIPAGRFPQRWLLMRPPAVPERNKRGRAAGGSRSGQLLVLKASEARSLPLLSGGLGNGGCPELSLATGGADGALEGSLVGMGWRALSRLPVVRSGQTRAKSRRELERLIQAG